jgi:serine protease Do
MAALNPFAPVSITLGRELAEVVERLRSSTVQVGANESGAGSGVIWQSDGLIVTNAHVASSSRHTVRLHDGRAFTAELIGREPRHDLAVLRIAATGLPAVRWRDAGSLRVGELVLAVGNPMGVAGAFTLGMLSASAGSTDSWLRADIRLFPGNSGGPLADVDGTVVGINSMIVGGFGVAVTSTAVERFLSRAERRIGVTVRPVHVSLGDAPALGLIVVELEAGGPAHLSGVLIGDVIVCMNGKRLSSAEQLSDAVQLAEGVLVVDVLRSKQLQTCQIRITREKVVEVA